MSANTSSRTLTHGILFLLLLFLSFLSFSSCQEYPSFDGFYHNEHFGDWGSIETPFLRMGGGTLYRDRTYEPFEAGRPNARVLSNELFAQPASDQPLTSIKNRTALLVFFGQQLFAELHDGLHAGCPVEYFNIAIPKCDPKFDPSCTGTASTPVTRSKYQATTGQGPSGPRMQLSENSAWIDGGSLYGNGKTWADCLRSRAGGMLKSLDPLGMFPALNDAGLPFTNIPPPTDNPGPGRIRHPKMRSVHAFLIHGNKAGSENPALTALQVMWFRNHNWHAKRLWTEAQARNESIDYWNDERLFMEARKWNVAEYQQIAVYEWLQAFVDKSLPPYQGYQSTLNPGVADVFQVAAMRFGHGLVPSALLRRRVPPVNQTGNEQVCVFRNSTNMFGAPGYQGLRTCNTLLRGNEILLEEVDYSGGNNGEGAAALRHGNFNPSVDSAAEFLLGLSSQFSEREDMFFTDDMRNFIFGPVNYNRRDLAALNIQRGRDNGIPDYNTVRAAYGLKRNEFEDITSNVTVQQKLRALYNNSTSMIDLFVGGMAETKDGPGELFTAIYMDQFARVRNGDRFWFENTANGLFTTAEIASIRATRLSDIIFRTTAIPTYAMQQNVFFLQPEDPCQPPANIGELSLEQCTPLATHDYYEDESSTALPGIAAFFFAFFICSLGGVAAAYWYEVRKRKRIMTAIDQSFQKTFKPFDPTITAPASVIVSTVMLKDATYAKSPLSQQKIEVNFSHTNAAPAIDPVQSTPLSLPVSSSNLTVQPSNLPSITPETILSSQESASATAPLPVPVVPAAIPPPTTTPFKRANSTSSPSSSKDAFSPNSSNGAGARRNQYGAVLYASNMGTASVYAEIVQHSKASDSAPSDCDSPDKSSSSSSQPLSWLHIRSAGAASDTLYNIPVSFIHSVHIFGERTRVREMAVLGRSPIYHTAAALASPRSPISRNAFSCSVMTRLNEELHAVTPYRVQPNPQSPQYPLYPRAPPSTGAAPMPRSLSAKTGAATAAALKKWPSGFDRESDPLDALKTRSVLLRVPKRYDVWLVFPDLRSRALFVLDLQQSWSRRNAFNGKGNHCLLVKQSVFSTSLLGMDSSTSIKTTQVRAAELQRFFQHLISTSIADLGSHHLKHQHANLPALTTSPDPPQPIDVQATTSNQSVPPKSSDTHHTSPIPNTSANAVGDTPATIFESGGVQMTAFVSPEFVNPSVAASGVNPELATPQPPLHIVPGSTRSSPPVVSVMSGRAADDSSAPPTVTSMTMAPSVARSNLATAMEALELDLDQTEALLDIEVDIYEFADALELNYDHAFVRQIFNMADRTKSGLVSFRGLEHVFLTLSKGGTSEKLRLLFDLYDMNGSHSLEIEELTSMIAESLRAAEEYDTPDRESRVEQEVAETLAEMYFKVGLELGEPVNFHQFQQMMTATIQVQPPESTFISEELESKAKTDEWIPIDGVHPMASPQPSSLVGAINVTKPSILNRLLTQGKRAISAEKSDDATTAASTKDGNRATKHSSTSSAYPSKRPTLARLDSHMILTHKKPSVEDKTIANVPSRFGFGYESQQSITKRSLVGRIRSWMNTYRSHIFIVVLFYLITFGIFAERFWVFAKQAEHVGIRRVTGYTVPITRGCASAIAFTLSLLLLTVCKNLLSYLQTTRSARFIPYASAQSFHILVSYTCCFFVFGHVFFHFFNWYQLSTQPVVDLPCYLPDVAYPSNFLPHFLFWYFQTPTNGTGVILTLFMIFFVTVAWCRNMIYKFFLTVHQYFFIIYVLVILHGCHQLFAYPVFWPFFIGPATIYIIDKLWSFARINRPLVVRRAQILPSKVVKLEIERPPHLIYSSGQYVRLSSDVFGRTDFHPFSLTSHCAPNHDFLSVHVRVVGPWTYQLYQLYHPAFLTRRPAQKQDDWVDVHKSSSQLPPGASGSFSPFSSASFTRSLNLDLTHSPNSLVKANNPNHNNNGNNAAMANAHPNVHPAHNRQQSHTFNSTTSCLYTPGPPAGLSSSSLPVEQHGQFMNKHPVGFVASNLDYYLPPINISGPYGGGHQEWSKYRTCVLIGAGIGITPFASILQDFMTLVTGERLAEKERERKRKKKLKQQPNTNGSGSAVPAAPIAQTAASSKPTHTRKSSLSITGLSKKNDQGQRVPVAAEQEKRKTKSHSSGSEPPPLFLYFVWIGRSHTGYEWLIDMIREAESLDHSTGRLHLQVQMFITTPPEQFDLRTAMGYAFERHFDRAPNGCSLFSGLRSNIGYGRPDFNNLFENIAKRHPSQEIGVFTSGGESLLDSVEKSCDFINSYRGSHFRHFAEQFQ